MSMLKSSNETEKVFLDNDSVNEEQQESAFVAQYVQEWTSNTTKREDAAVLKGEDSVGSPRLFAVGSGEPSGAVKRSSRGKKLGAVLKDLSGSGSNAIEQQREMSSLRISPRAYLVRRKSSLQEERRKAFYENLYLDAERREYIREMIEKEKEYTTLPKKKPMKASVASEKWALRWKELVDSKSRTKMTNEATRRRNEYHKDIQESKECFFKPITLQRRLNSKEMKVFIEKLIELKEDQNKLREHFEKIDNLEETIEDSIRLDFLYYERKAESRDMKLQCLLHYKNEYASKFDLLQSERAKILAAMTTLDAKVERFCSQTCISKPQDKFAEYYNFNLTTQAEAYLKNDSFNITLKKATKERALFSTELSDSELETVKAREAQDIPTKDSSKVASIEDLPQVEIAATQMPEPVVMPELVQAPAQVQPYQELNSQLQRAHQQHKMIFWQMQHFFGQNINNTFNYTQMLVQQPFIAILNEQEQELLQNTPKTQQPQYAFAIVRQKMQERLQKIHESFHRGEQNPVSACDTIHQATPKHAEMLPTINVAVAEKLSAMQNSGNNSSIRDVNVDGGALSSRCHAIADRMNPVEAKTINTDSISTMQVKNYTLTNAKGRHPKKASPSSLNQFLYSVEDDTSIEPVEKCDEIEEVVTEKPEGSATDSSSYTSFFSNIANFGFFKTAPEVKKEDSSKSLHRNGSFDFSKYWGENPGHAQVKQFTKDPKSQNIMNFLTGINK